MQDKLQSEKIISVKLVDGMDQVARFFENDPMISQVNKIPERGLLTFLYKGTAENQQELLRKAVAAELSILSFSEEETDLEDVFMEITKGADTL
jgi:ABC-2 type transport system ATP-binding protein